MKIFIFLVIVLLVGYGAAVSYFYFDLITRNRQLVATMDEAQSLKRRLQEEVVSKDTLGEKLQKENEQLKKESVDYLKRQKEINDKCQQIEKLLKQQAQEAKRKEDKLEQAQKELTELRENNAKLSDISALAGNVQIRKQEEKIGKLKKGLLAFQDRIKKQEAFLHYNLGVSYTKEKKYELAIDEFERALKLSANDADTHYNLAIIYDDYKENPKKAVQHYKKYLELRPDAADIDEVKEWIARLEK